MSAPPRISETAAHAAMRSQSAAAIGRKKKSESWTPAKNGANGFSQRSQRQRSGTASTG